MQWIGGGLRLWSCDGYPWWSQHWLQRVQGQQGNFAGCGAVFGEASTGYNECSGHNGNLAGCGATGCWSQRALCGTSRNWDLGRLWSLFGAPGEGSTGYNECTDLGGF